MKKILVLLFLTINLLFSYQRGIVIGLDPNGDGFLSLRTKPRGKEIYRLHNGDRLIILKKIGKWYKIKINNGQIGYAYGKWIHKISSNSNKGLSLISKNDTWVNFQLSSQTEACEIYVRNIPINGSRLMVNDCIFLTNSNNIDIICTKNKSICKTNAEIESYADLFQNKNRNIEKTYIHQVKPNIEDFSVVIQPFDKLNLTATRYEQTEFENKILGKVYRFTGTITDISSNGNSFTMRINFSHSVNIKGHFNIQKLLQANKLGQEVTVYAKLISLGTGNFIKHEAIIVNY